jgi:membrane protein
VSPAFSKGTSVLGRVGRVLIELVVDTLKQFRVISGKTKALGLAGEAFMVIIPAMIIISAIVGGGSSGNAASALVRRYGLTGSAASSVNSLFAKPPGVSGAVNIVSIAVLLLSLLTLARVMQATFEEAWGLEPARGMRANIQGLSGLGLLVVQVIVLGLILSVLASSLGHSSFATVTGTLLRLAFAFVAWLVLIYLLLIRRIPWRRLIPAALVSTAGQAICSIASSIYVPHLIAKYASRYGLIGVTLALISWLILVSTVIVFGAIIGAELDRLRAHRRLPVAADPAPAAGGGG